MKQRQKPQQKPRTLKRKIEMLFQKLGPSNYQLTQLIYKMSELSKEIINAIIKDEYDTDECKLITDIPILPLMAVLPPMLPPLQKPLEGTIESCVKGLSKNQDVVRTGKKGEEYFWIICCDGHGNNSFVDILKALD